MNEAYLALFGNEPLKFEDRRHFSRLVSRVTRQVLVNYAEARRSLKRGSDQPTTLPLEKAPAAAMTDLRFFAGLTHEEIAETLEVSLATVGRDWALARACLKWELGAEVGM